MIIECNHVKCRNRLGAINRNRMKRKRPAKRAVKRQDRFQYATMRERASTADRQADRTRKNLYIYRAISPPRFHCRVARSRDDEAAKSVGWRGVAGGVKDHHRKWIKKLSHR